MRMLAVIRCACAKTVSGCAITDVEDGRAKPQLGAKFGRVQASGHLASGSRRIMSSCGGASHAHIDNRDAISGALSCLSCEASNAWWATSTYTFSRSIQQRTLIPPWQGTVKRQDL